MQPALKSFFSQKVLGLGNSRNRESNGAVLFMLATFLRPGARHITGMPG